MKRSIYYNIQVSTETTKKYWFAITTAIVDTTTNQNLSYLYNTNLVQKMLWSLRKEGRHLRGVYCLPALH